MIAEHYKATGVETTTAVSVISQLLSDNKDITNLKHIYLFDNMMIQGTPSASIVFNTLRISTKALGSALGNAERRCSEMVMNFSLYMYLEVFEPGSDTFTHLATLGKVVKLLHANNLYKFCTAGAAFVNQASFIGRRLQSNSYLTALIDFNVPVRF